MGIEWREFRFEELLEIPLRNGIYKKKEFHGSGSRIVNMGELFAYPRLFDVPMKRVELDEKDRQNALLEEGDLLFARRSLTAEGAGKCSIVKEVCEETTFESSLIRARPNKKTALPDYLYYFFDSPQGRHLIGTILRQVAVSGITGTDLKQLKIPLPSLCRQRSVSDILASLDDKIALNHQINTTLESMAQALFKSWFVDFDPVIDNALAAGNPIPETLKARADARAALGDQRKPLPDHIRQQFPDRFVQTEEMGWVPEGWIVGSFNDIALQVRSNAKTEEIASNDFYVGLEHIGRKQFFLSDYGNGSSVESNKSRFQRSDLLFGKLRPYFHKVCQAPFDGVCSTDILVFRSKEPLHNSFMYMTAYREDFVEYANACSTGTRMPRANAKDLLTFAVVIPPGKLREAFEDLTAPNWDKGVAGVRESESLSKLRDTLLPKLLSGELRVPEAEMKLAEIL